MKTMSRFVALVAVVSTMLGVLALPALAQPSVVVFTGTATVCATTVPTKTNAAGCPIKAGENQGLYLVGHPGGVGFPRLGLTQEKWMNRFGNYKFSNSNLVGGQPVNCVYINPLDPDFATSFPKTCNINAAGKLAPVMGIGAACGMSQGLAGVGNLTTPSNGGNAALTGVGWPASAGGTLPLTGTYTIVTPGAGKKGAAGNTGPLVGVVQAQGGAGCVKSPLTGDSGASTFNVVGVVAAI